MSARTLDLHRLHQAIDAERQQQGLSWTALSRQVGVAASTIRRYADANDAEADGVLNLIQWLDAAPEHYITNNTLTPTKLPPLESGRARVDMSRIAEATTDPRGADGRTRTTIQRVVRAAEHSGQPIAALTRLTDL
ncbi:MAG: hypothetical protein AAF480_08680 [Actinomycetota bacterium]